MYLFILGQGLSVSSHSPSSPCPWVCWDDRWIFEKPGVWVLTFLQSTSLTIFLKRCLQSEHCRVLSFSVFSSVLLYPVIHTSAGSPKRITRSESHVHLFCIHAFCKDPCGQNDTSEEMVVSFVMQNFISGDLNLATIRYRRHKLKRTPDVVTRMVTGVC